MITTSTRNVCVACRATVPFGPDDVSCALCRGPVFLVGSKWRAPRKTNSAAWARVMAGELLWDRRAVARSHRRAAVTRAAMAVGAKAARRRRLDQVTSGERPTPPHIHPVRRQSTPTEDPR